VLIESDHVVATVGENTLRHDLYRAAPVDAQVVLYVHGGGWRSGDQADGATERFAALAACGVTVRRPSTGWCRGQRFPTRSTM
jgi:acetyl esterase/lipase